MIGLFGNSYWSERLMAALRKDHMPARCLYPGREQAIRRWSLHKWLSEAEPWECDVLHVQGWPQLWKCWLAARIRHVPVVLHWIGSDVSSFLKSPRWSRVAGRILNALVPLHLAVSKQLVRELRSVGIYARYQVNAATSFDGVPVLPLPAEACVLSLLRHDRFEFYGGREVLEMVSRTPDVRWLVVGSDGKGLPKLPNVKYLGHMDHAAMDDIYRKVTVLVRLTRHDGMANMVLEALARGRYVIWSQPMPFCWRASTVASALTCLDRALAMRPPNLEGAQFVRSEFDVKTQTAELRKIYAAIAGGWFRGLGELD